MIKHFWNGSITVFGIKRRFEHRNVNDKYFHSIPVLAGGPGTGKSRFLDEIERIVSMNLMRKYYNFIKRYVHTFNMVQCNSMSIPTEYISVVEQFLLEFLDLRLEILSTPIPICLYFNLCIIINNFYR
uniref:Uncharacterized protein n=1 Tax=Rhizophagus irregularis (strain DAOM 181602 / DAOM 197198 / MUCL 43194) TaxID=747089 RepID=U9TSW0_RHIID